MTTRHRRLVGRAYRRRARGVPVTSRAVTFEHALRQIRASWPAIRDAFQAAFRTTQADYVLVPPLPPLPRAAVPAAR